MAICLEFQLIERRGDIAVYRFNNCLQDEFGLVEVNIPALLSGEVAGDALMQDVARLLPSGLMSQWRANRVFGKVYKYYEEHGVYPDKGGYYA